MPIFPLLIESVYSAKPNPFSVSRKSVFPFGVEKSPPKGMGPRLEKRCQNGFGFVVLAG
jgi:hypothetical protein